MHPMSELDLSIIVISWNTRELLRACLDSVRSYTDGIRYEIIVIDNASRDGSVDMLTSHYPYVRLLTNEKNEGFSKANNKGIRKASGEFILLLNSDTSIRENVFFELVSLMRENAEVGVCSPAILSMSGEVQTMRTWNMTPFQSFRRIINCYRIQGERRSQGDGDKRVSDADIVAGVCFMVRRQVFDEVGLLDENYFMYNEEDDFCRRTRKKGWRIAYVPSVRIYHHRGGSYRDKATRLMVKIKTYESDLYFFRKHYHWLTVWLLKSTYKGVIAIKFIMLLTRYGISLFRDGVIRQELKSNWKLFLLKE